MQAAHASYPPLHTDYCGCPNYMPIRFTHPTVLAQPVWADPPLHPDEYDKLPQNPLGNTGYTGRGLLGKYGPNKAADAVVMRRNSGKLEMVVVQRKDCGEWAIPGGMVDSTDDFVKRTALREFKEEAVASADPETIKAVDEMFSAGIKVYDGPVRDPRNTDVAWMHTTVYLFFISSDNPLRNIQLQAGDDAKDCKWIDAEDPDLKLYANHAEFVQMALKHV